jgi:predicted nucleic acid-binding protein
VSVLLVLDAATFDVLDTPRGRQLRILMREILNAGGRARCAVITLAEVCRRTARTRRVEASLARDRGGHRIQVVPTDERFAKLVGAILHDTGHGSDRIADAHVVAACTASDTAVVFTSDPDDIAALATAVPGTRIIIRDPAAPL